MLSAKMQAQSVSDAFNIDKLCVRQMRTETASNAIMFLIFARSIFLYKKTGEAFFYHSFPVCIQAESKNSIVSKCVAINRKTFYVLPSRLIFYFLQQ